MFRTGSRPKQGCFFVVRQITMCMRSCLWCRRLVLYKQVIFLIPTVSAIWANYLQTGNDFSPQAQELQPASFPSSLLLANLRRARKGAAPGPSGLTAELLRLVLHHGGSESRPSPTAPNHKPSARPRPDHCSPKAERQGPRHRRG